MIKQIEARLAQLVSGEETLYAAARYLLLAPAKRIRPQLLFACCESHGAIPKAALDVACALEMIHTYSLIHDDLPAMDDDDLRRGLPTLHVKYDEATAILAGDFLLTYAFEVLASIHDCPPTTTVKLIQTLAIASGARGMVGGQVLDIEHSPDITKMHAMKTAALFQCAMESGALLSNSPHKEALKTFGLQFGLLFQLIDDLMDHDHPEGDAIAYEKALNMSHQAEALLTSLPINSKPLLTLLNKLNESLCTCQVS